MTVLPLPTPERREVRCRNRRCRCVLTDPESVALGYGPDCAELLGLIPPRVRVAWGRQDGPTLFDQLNEGAALSYDIDLTVDTGGPEPFYVGYGWNYTSNCAPMWRLAGADLADFHGKRADDCLPVLVAAIRRMEGDPATFRALDPPNGWGSYATLLPALRDLANQFRAHPDATVAVSR